MKTIILRSVFVLTFIALSAVQTLAQRKENSGDVISTWIETQIKFVRTANGVPHVAFSRHFAFAALASYECAIAKEVGYHSLGGKLQGLGALPVYDGRTSYRAPVAVNAAYAEVLRYLYPANGLMTIDSLERSIKLSLKLNASEGDESVAFGKKVAHFIIEWSKGDGSINVIKDYAPKTGDEFWRTTPPAFGAAAVPHWGSNRTVIANSTAIINKEKGPAFSSEPKSDFYLMAKEVYDVSLKLTDEQRNIALFWDDSPGKFVSVFGHWSSILAQVIRERKLPLPIAAKAYAAMTLSMHDAAIAAWIGKYSQLTLRPVTYIQKYIKPEWLPLIETPPHPEFPAAHATLSTAAATALTAVLGKVAFTDSTYLPIGMKPRSFKSFGEASKEAGMSRLYGGIHYRYSIEHGSTIGRSVAEEVIASLGFKN